jgi:ribosome biogenesis GTPase / thiamine phosphate phosphatase
MQGRITNILCDKYIIDDKYKSILNGNLKKNKIYVGDIVNFDLSYDTYVISSVEERSNFSIRPPVSNIDQMIICLSVKNPKPDYMLLDKQIIMCLSKNITPIICITKTDLESDEKNYIYSTYKDLDIKIIDISIEKNINIDILLKVLENKTSAFSRKFWCWKI